MIRRLYVNNYKCLVNFEIHFGPLQLLMGPSGGGKSTVFEVLRLLREFVCNGKPVDELFLPGTLTRWYVHDHPVQTFELEILENNGIYKYVLDIEHNPKKSSARMKRESLIYNDAPLFEYHPDGMVQLYRDDHSEGPKYPAVSSRSALEPIGERNDAVALTLFKRSLERTFFVRLNPFTILDESREEEIYPTPSMNNFASWFRCISQDRQSKVFDLVQELREIWEDFKEFRLEILGEGRILKLVFDTSDGDRHSYKMSELSEGQKALLVLYALLYTIPDEGASLCIDEPENFLPLPEIQPWLDKVHDFLEDEAAQFLLISHHPRVINFLAEDQGLWISRDSFNSPSRVRPIQSKDASGLPVSQLVERGWIYDEFEE